MNRNQEQPNFEAEYRREYGIHELPLGGIEGDPVYVASFENFDDFKQYVEENGLPQQGTIATNELLTLPKNIQKVEEGRDEIYQSLQDVLEMSKTTEAEIILGTPYEQPYAESPFQVPKNEWFNAALSIKNGEITDIITKTGLLPVENEIGLVEQLRPPKREVKNGRAVLICAELTALFAGDAKFSHVGKEAKELLMLASWATPYMENPVAYQKAGGRDEYFKGGLEMVASELFAQFDQLEKIHIADDGGKRDTDGKPILQPLSGVLKRKTPN